MSGDVANEHSADDDLYRYTTMKETMHRESNEQLEDTIIFNSLQHKPNIDGSDDQAKSQVQQLPDIASLGRNLKKQSNSLLKSKSRLNGND